jgi:hypothetical protein
MRLAKGTFSLRQKGIAEMQASHALGAVSASRFDDPSLVSCAGSVPVTELADSCALAGLVAGKLSMLSPNARLEMSALVARMIAGRTRPRTWICCTTTARPACSLTCVPPSAFATILHAFTVGHVRPLDSVAAEVLPALAGWCPLLPAVDQLAFLDMDDTVRGTHGYTGQGAGYGYSKVKDLNALLATLSTPAAAPVIIAPTLRKGWSTAAVHRPSGRDHRAADRRVESAYYNQSVIALAVRTGASFSITARMDPTVRRAISAIEKSAWTPIHYPDTVWDEDEQRLVSDAEVTEMGFTAFASRRIGEQIDGRLFVRHVKRLKPTSLAADADAGIVAVCDRFDLDSVATLNRRDFDNLRRRHRLALNIVPE